MEDVKVGFGFLWNEPLIRAFAIGAGVINLGFTAAVAILVLLAQDSLGLDAFGFGLLLGFAAVGGVIGAALAPRTCDGDRRRRHYCPAIPSD